MTIKEKICIGFALTLIAGSLLSEPPKQYSLEELQRRHEQRLQDRANKALLQEWQEAIRHERAKLWLKEQ